MTNNANLVQCEKMLQDLILPDPSCVEGVEIVPYLRHGETIGSDFYSFHQPDQHTVYFAIGDVSGKGIASSVFMVMAQAKLEALFDSDLSPAQIAQKMNAYFSQRNPNSLYISLIVGKLMVDTGELVYVNAGHAAPFIVSQSKVGLLNGDQNIAIGVSEDHYFQESTTSVDTGSFIFLYTRGLTLIENDAGEAFGKEALAAALRAKASTAKELVKTVLSEIRAYNGRKVLKEDVCLLGIKVKGEMTAITDELKVHFENDVEELQKLQKVVALFGNANKIPEDFQMTINLVLEELLTNTIFYGYEDHDLHHIQVLMTFKENEFKAVIEDDGIPFDPLTQSPDVDTTNVLEERSVGGLGIHFVKSLMDTLVYERTDNKNILTMTHQLNKKES